MTTIKKLKEELQIIENENKMLEKEIKRKNVDFKVEIMSKVKDVARDYETVCLY